MPREARDVVEAYLRFADSEALIAFCDVLDDDAQRIGAPTPDE